MAGIDLGEVHIAAVSTTRRYGLILSGQLLRSWKQARNKAHAAIQAKLSRCQTDSQRAKRLRQRKAEVSATLYRQQREILHQAARQVITFCQQEGVQRIVVGDVRDIQTGVSLGHVTNRKISQWPHGQFFRYLREKAARVSISVTWIDEAYSTKTCAWCICAGILPTRAAVSLCGLWGDAASGRQWRGQHLLQGSLWRLRQSAVRCGEVSTAYRRSAPDTGLSR